MPIGIDNTKLIPAGITVNKDANNNYQCIVTFGASSATSNLGSIVFSSNSNLSGGTCAPAAQTGTIYWVSISGGDGSTAMQSSWAGNTVIFTGFGPANPSPLYITCSNNNYVVSAQ